MNFIEDDLARCVKRIKRIEENPDPTKLKSNKLLYELERDFRLAQIQAIKEGKPLAEGTLTPSLFKAMGFEFSDLDASTQKATENSQRYMDILRSAGFPEWACDLAIIPLALVMSGDYPPPDFVLNGMNMACDPLRTGYEALGRWCQVPVFTIDIPMHHDLDTVRYVTQQFGEAIEYAEAKVPGAKFSEEKFMELEEYNRLGQRYLKDIYELKKRVPCPLDGQDAFRIPRQASEYANPAKAIEYFRNYRDELGERAEKGLGAVKEEKLRFVWSVSGTFYFNPFKILAQRGVSVPWFHFGMGMRWYGVLPRYGDESEFGRKLSPLEELARMFSYNVWRSDASRWVESLRFICRDLKIDGIVNFVQTGCIATVCLNKMTAEMLEKELGIPSLMIEGRMLDKSTFNQEETDSRLNQFIDICMARKYGPK